MAKDKATPPQRISGIWRLAKMLWRSIPRTFVVWQMNEAADRNNGIIYSCATCGMALTEPCKHWTQFEIDAIESEGGQS